MTTSYELSQSVETSQQRSEWARLYAQARQQYTEVIRMLRQRASGDTIADIGCGPGASVPICQANGFSSVLGIDVDEPALAFAAASARGLGYGPDPIWWTG